MNNDPNNGSDSYVPIRVGTLRGDQKINFDVYIKINDKFVHYLRNGDSFEGERLLRLKAKNLKKMFIPADHESVYREYLRSNIDLAYDKNSGKSMQIRSEIIHGDQQSQAEDVMENPASQITYNDAKNTAGKFVEFLTNEDSAVAHILAIENIDHNIAHHGVTVSALSNALAKQLAMTDAKQLQLLTLGALLHDFEHFHSGLNIVRTLKDFSPQELETYKNHPLSGAHRVQDKKHFDQSVINIIAQHEEYIDGKGFPSGLVEAKMDPLALIVASCNALDRMITFEGLEKKAAVKHFLMSSVGKYPLQHIQILGGIMSQVK